MHPAARPSVAGGSQPIFHPFVDRPTEPRQKRRLVLKVPLPQPTDSRAIRRAPKSIVGAGETLDRTAPPPQHFPRSALAFARNSAIKAVPHRMGGTGNARQQPYYLIGEQRANELLECSTLRESTSRRQNHQLPPTTDLPSRFGRSGFSARASSSATDLSSSNVRNLESPIQLDIGAEEECVVNVLDTTPTDEGVVYAAGAAASEPSTSAESQIVNMTLEEQQQQRREIVKQLAAENAYLKDQLESAVFKIKQLEGLVWDRNTQMKKLLAENLQFAAKLAKAKALIGEDEFSTL